MGELHLDIIIDRLRREFKVECNQGKSSGNLQRSYHADLSNFVKFTRSSLVVVVSLPISSSVSNRQMKSFEGSLQFIDEVKGGNVPKEFIPSVQKGFEKAMKNGVLAGYPSGFFLIG